MLWVLICTVHLTVCYYHVTYEFQRESTLLNLSDSNEIRNHYPLVCKQIFNHFAQLSKWLSCVVTTYLYGACYHHFMYKFYSEYTLYSCLNVKEPVSRNAKEPLAAAGLETRTPLFVNKYSIVYQKLAKRVNWVVNTYLHGAFYWMLDFILHFT